MNRSIKGLIPRLGISAARIGAFAAASVLLAGSLCLGGCLSSNNEPVELPQVDYNVALNMTYDGVEGWGSIMADEVKAEGAKVYRFSSADGEQKLYSIQFQEGYPIQNQLMEGYSYDLVLDGDCITGLSSKYSISIYMGSVVKASVGLRTLKNFLQGALMPMGTTLYVYGGGWDWQDEGASQQACTIGVPKSWYEFYKSRGAAYINEDESNPASATTYYAGWNQYYYAGLDCSAYIGWLVYNLNNSESGNDGYVVPSKKMASSLADTGFGTLRTEPISRAIRDLKVGDIVSISASHCYIVVGCCKDGSYVIAHCSGTPSALGNTAGGVQLSAVAKNGDKDCDAYRLADQYMKQYFPEWTAAFPTVCCDYDTYIDIEKGGVFSWSIGEGGYLTDPEGLSEMSAEEVLAVLFK